MSASLKFISLNIERSKHLERVIPFLVREKPDVVCLQELLEHDIPVFENVLGPCVVFGDEGLHTADEPGGAPKRIGNGVFSRLHVSKFGSEYYVGSLAHAQVNEQKEYLTDLCVSWADVEMNADTFRFMTTHFTWTPDGSASDDQRRNLSALLDTLKNMGEFVLSGDFNAPRIHKGTKGEIFGMLAATYTDNIPKRYESTLDPVLHVL